MALVASTFGNIFTYARSLYATSLSDAGDYSEVPPNTIRTSPTNGWLLEPFATNLVRNPRAEGVTIGGDASNTAHMPTNWGGGLLTNCTGVITGVGTTKGVNWIEVAITAQASGSVRLNFEGGGGPSGLSVGAGGTTTLSYFSQFVGTIPPEIISSTLRATGADSTTVTSAIDNNFTRKSGTFAYAAGAVSSAVSFNVAFGAACAFTFRIGWPQFELGSIASRPILPPIGTTSLQANRNADSLQITGTPFTTIFGAGAPSGTIILDGLLPQIPVASVSQYLLDLRSDVNNRIGFRNGGGFAQISAVVVNGGVTGSTTAAHTFTPGTWFRTGLRWGPTSFSTCFNGGTVNTASNTMPTGHTSLYLGSFGGASNMSGRIKLAACYNYAMTDAAFQAATVQGAKLT